MSSDLRKAILENISIEELLREEGFEVIPRGRKLTVKGHDSLVIQPGMRRLGHRPVYGAAWL